MIEYECNNSIGIRSMFVAESCLLYGPKLSLSELKLKLELKLKILIPNSVSSLKSTTSPQFIPKSRRDLILGQRGSVLGVVCRMRMDGEGEDDDKGEAQGNSVLEQEEFNPLFVAPPSPTVRTALQSNFNRLSKWLVAALFTAAILWRHDAEALWAAMGSVLNTALSVVLKRILNQERPNSAISSGPGMPSSHAQSIFYTAVFIIWSLIQWLRVNELSLALSTLVLAFGSYLSWLRVSQQYHTMSQVGVGAAVGSCFAFLWLWTWQAFVLHAFASTLWVRLVVVVGSIVFCLCFLLHVVRHWLQD